MLQRGIEPRSAAWKAASFTTSPLQQTAVQVGGSVWFMYKPAHDGTIHNKLPFHANLRGPKKCADRPAVLSSLVDFDQEQDVCLPHNNM
jgi:hypothetical protein